MAYQIDNENINVNISELIDIVKLHKSRFMSEYNLMISKFATPVQVTSVDENGNVVTTVNYELKPLQ